MHQPNEKFHKRSQVKSRRNISEATGRLFFINPQINEKISIICVTNSSHTLHMVHQCRLPILSIFFFSSSRILKSVVQIAHESFMMKDMMWLQRYHMFKFNHHYRLPSDILNDRHSYDYFTRLMVCLFQFRYFY